MSYHKYITNTFAYQPFLCTQTCLCPCERSHLEPLCMHTYHNKYTYIISQIYHKYVCVSTLVVHSHLLVPLRALTLRTSLWTYIYSQVYIYHITNISQIHLRINPCCALSCLPNALTVINVSISNVEHFWYKSVHLQLASMFVQHAVVKCEKNKKRKKRFQTVTVWTSSPARM